MTNNQSTLRYPPGVFPGDLNFGDSFWLWYYLCRRIYKRDFDLRHTKENKTDDEIRSDIEVLISDLDKVPPGIIAQVDINKLFDVAPPFCKEILRLCLEKDHQQHLHLDDIEKKSPEDRMASTKRKGVPRTIIMEPAASLVNSLTGDERDASLFVSDSETLEEIKKLEQQFGKNNNSSSYANVFFVDKSSVNPETNRPFQRLITDARTANAMLKNMARMELFTLETLMSRFAMAFNVANNQTKTKRVYALSADLRHYFHQIKLPRHFRKYFAMTTRDINKKQRVVFPRAFCMGSNFAPGTAQAVTWSMLLAGLHDVESKEVNSLRKELGIGEDQKFDEYLTWLPLKDGGAVFVLIDNIFVITPNAAVANHWKNRIVTTTNKFRATLKRSDLTDISDRENSSDDVESKVLHFGKDATNGGQTIKFSGIEFSGKGRKTATELEDFEIPTATEAVSWNCTYRKLASVLGQCLWHMRVQGKTMLELEDFIQLYQVAYPLTTSNNTNNNNQQVKDSWNSTTTIAGNNLIILRKYVNSCLNETWAPFDMSPQQITRTFFMATDASGGTQRGIGIVFKELATEVTRTNFDWNIFGGETHDHDLIVYGELQAVIDGLQKLVSISGVKDARTCSLIMLAIDNISAMHMISRGYSPHEKARDMLKILFTLMKENNLKLVLEYIKSGDNPADEPSRNKEVCDQKLDLLEVRFSRLEKLAREDLFNSGKNRVVAKNLPLEQLLPVDERRAHPTNQLTAMFGQLTPLLNNVASCVGMFKYPMPRSDESLTFWHFFQDLLLLFIDPSERVLYFAEWTKRPLVQKELGMCRSAFDSFTPSEKVQTRQYVMACGEVYKNFLKEATPATFAADNTALLAGAITYAAGEDNTHMPHTIGKLLLPLANIAITSAHFYSRYDNSTNAMMKIQDTNFVLVHNVLTGFTNSFFSKAVIAQNAADLIGKCKSNWIIVMNASEIDYGTGTVAPSLLTNQAGGNNTQQQQQQQQVHHHHHHHHNQHHHHHAHLYQHPHHHHHTQHQHNTRHQGHHQQNHHQNHYQHQQHHHHYHHHSYQQQQHHHQPPRLDQQKSCKKCFDFLTSAAGLALAAAVPADYVHIKDRVERHNADRCFRITNNQGVTRALTSQEYEARVAENNAPNPNRANAANRGVNVVPRGYGGVPFGGGGRGGGYHLGGAGRGGYGRGGYGRGQGNGYGYY